MREILYRHSLREAFDEELTRDEHVVIMGEEVAQYNGAYKVTEGLWEKWGCKRIVDKHVFWSCTALWLTGPLPPVFCSQFSLHSVHVCLWYRIKFQLKR